MPGAPPDLNLGGEAEDVEVRDVAYLVLGEGDPAAEVPRDGEGAVGGAELPPWKDDQTRADLSWVQ